jgi:hypothetical protein
VMVAAAVSWETRVIALMVKESLEIDFDPF